MVTHSSPKLHREHPQAPNPQSKMKLFVVLVLVAAAAAAPQQSRPSRQSPQDQDIQILRYENENSGLGQYSFGYEQSNGQRQEEQGELKNQGAEDEYLSVKGSYSWVGPDGVTYVVNYIADNNGFQPTIEQGPGGGVPPAVVASLLG